MRLADGIFFHEEADHTGFLFSFEDCSSLILNRMGVFIIKSLLAGHGEDELLQEMQAASAKPLPERAQKDISDFLDRLKDKGFLLKNT